MHTMTLLNLDLIVFILRMGNRIHLPQEMLDIIVMKIGFKGQIH